ncbi:diaminopimelate epimerase [Lachnospiraceae bacterium KM106-2]|nr:diaminopimelate epimerase [Lachnospiraceae bacterium KM106-2]
MKFTKMHGCGNDYIFINSLKEEVPSPAYLAKKISDRHFGVGADGLVLIGSSQTADYSMKMFNPDGSIGEMCGNAIRCIGKYVYENHLTNKTTITVETLAGIKTLFLTIRNNEVIEVMVDMGKPIVEPCAIPVMSEKNIVIDEPISIMGVEYRMTCVSMGNPHAVVFVDSVGGLKIDQIGIPFEYNLRFPNRTNVEFVQIVDRNNIKMRVWERGTGETLACGTGACAAVMAGIYNNLLEERVVVKLKGGILKVEYDSKDNIVYLSGPAKMVFEGDMMLTWLV